MLNVKKHHQIVDSLIFAVDTVLFNCVLKIPESPIFFFTIYPKLTIVGCVRQSVSM